MQLSCELFSLLQAIRCVHYPWQVVLLPGDGGSGMGSAWPPSSDSPNQYQFTILSGIFSILHKRVPIIIPILEPHFSVFLQYFASKILKNCILGGIGSGPADAGG